MTYALEVFAVVLLVAAAVLVPALVLVYTAAVVGAIAYRRELAERGN